MTLEEMKKIKQERGYSLAQLSNYSGVPLGTLQKIFSGETETPRYATRKALENVLSDEKYEYEREEQMVEESTVYEAARPKKQGEYTLEDYYTLPDDRRVELIDGVIYDMSAPTFVHQHISGVIYNTIRKFID